MKRLCLSFLALMFAVSASAQVPATPPPGTNVELDPIRCWWRTAAGAVRVGEIFELSLTCAVLDNDAVQVIADESRLGPAAIQLAPFEVVGGSHPADLQSGGRRFFQYHYQLRIISPDAIGRDAPLPSVQIHYTINNRVNGGGNVQGRDLVYLLPTEFVRIASMVPVNAVDIRDAGGVDFAKVESLQFRANVLDLVAMSAVALGVVVLIVMLVALARRVRTRVPAGERQLSPRALVGAALGELAAVAKEREAQGWTADLAARALAATRVAATAAVGGNIGQRLAGPESSAGDGRLIVREGLRGKTRIVSGSATAFDLERAVRTATGAASARVPLLESLRDAIARFGASQYGRAQALDQTSLDDALASARSAAGQVRAEHSWLKTQLKQWRGGSATPVASRA